MRGAKTRALYRLVVNAKSEFRIRMLIGQIDTNLRANKLPQALVDSADPREFGGVVHQLLGLWGTRTPDCGKAKALAVLNFSSTAGFVRDRVEPSHCRLTHRCSGPL